MARRRWYRRSVRVVAAKKKWASNLKTGTIPSLDTADLAVNSLGSATPTPVIVKTGNFKVQGDVTFNSVSSSVTFASVVVYLVFIPEGMTGITSIPENHPEYIMGWTVVDCPLVPSGSGSNAGSKYSITSRLKRNLNSGDRVSLMYRFSSGATSVTATITYVAQWFTCAN